MLLFKNKLWWAMKSGYSTLMWNGRDHGVSEMNHHQPHQSPVFIHLCILWESKWALYYELLPENQTVNSSEYFSQLYQLKAALDEKCLKLVNKKCIIFHQDDVRPHVSLMTRQKLLQLDLEDLTHLPYLPDIALSDFHLFCFLQDSLTGRKF